MSTQLDAVEAPPTRQPFFVAHRKALVIGSRTALLMLCIAALAVLGLGVAAVVLGDGPEVDGWLRMLFGKVFAVVAVGMAAVLGIPAGVGLWAMAGATADGAAPALGPMPRRILVGIAVAVVAASAVAVLVDGTPSRLVNLGMVGLIALSSLGLAGAVSFSSHRGRAALSGVALAVVAGGTAWMLARVAFGAAA
jgi:hypothetical protein